MFGFTMRVPDADVEAVGNLLAAHTEWMGETHSLTAERSKLHTLEYFVSKATELLDMIDHSMSATGYLIFSASQVHLDDKQFSNHAELGQTWKRIGEFFEFFEKYSPLVTMCGRVTAKL